MLDTQVNQMIDDFARRMQSQGLTMDQYLQFTGTTLASLQEQMKPQGSEENSDKTGSGEDRRS